MGHDDDALETTKEPTDDDSRARGEVGGAESWTVRRSGPSARLVLALVAVVVLVVFAVLNFDPVRVNFLVFTTRARIVTVIAVAAMLGFVVGWFVGRPARGERRHLREWRAGATREPDH
jgi:uncharacterized integral membrane protein